MRIRSIRVRGAPGLGPVSVRPGEGLVAWVGGDARDRKALVEILCWLVGVPIRNGARPGPDAEEGTLPEGELEVEVGGRLLQLRGRGLVADASEGGAGTLAEEVGLPADALGFAWAGGADADLSSFTDEAVRALAGARGLGRLERGIARLEGLGGDGARPASGSDDDRRALEAGERARLEAELAEVRERIGELEDVPERLRSLEAELRSLRADAAEVAGDLEVATMDWLRERQDAETNLHAYRDRARELRERIRTLQEAGPDSPCPFCGRSLDDHFDLVMSELDDEWERLVQDGKWWRRRWEQLELKPDHLQELEGKSVRLQAAVEERAERLERCRFDLRELDELRRRRRELLDAMGGADPEAEERGGDDAPPEEGRRRSLLDAFGGVRRDLLDAAQERILRRAGAYLNRISGGRVLGLVREGAGPPAPLEDGRPVALATDEDRAAVRVAVRLALATLLVEDGVPLGSVLVDEPFGHMEPAARFRGVELLRGIRATIPQILLLARGETAESAPERFHQIFEFREGRGDGVPTLRALPGGVGTLRLA